MIKPNRTDPQYLEVEKFSKCELTNNICFEMAIRLDIVQDMILIINDCYYKTPIILKINEIYTKYNKFFPKENNCEYFSQINLNISEIKNILKNILHEVFYLNEINGDETWLNFYNFMPFYNNKLKEFPKKNYINDFHIINEIENDFLEGSYDELYELDSKNSNILNQRYDYFTEFWTDHVYINEKLCWQIKNFKHFALTNYLIDKEQDLRNEEKNLFIIEKNSYYTNEHIIHQNFSRPLLKNSSTNKFVTLKDINLNLPDEELFEYIRTLKKEFNIDKNKQEMEEHKSNFITWHEIYNNKTFPTKNEIHIKNKAKDTLLTPKKFIDTFDNNTKIADMLFIYDAKKQEMTQKDIIAELSYYHNVQKDGTLINQYYEFAIQFINYCHYKKYLSGIYLIKTSI